MKIYAGNLAHATTSDELRRAFEAHGTVENVSLISDRDTGQPRGFGFLEMGNAAEANAAINALNGTELGGRTIRVSESTPRPQGSFNRR